MPQSSGSVTDLIWAGLKAEGVRQEAIASNIANIQTPGYRRIDVRFENLLAKAMNSSGHVDVGEIEPETYCPGNTPVKSNGNDVDLDTEVGQLVKNSLRQTAYVRLLHKKATQIDAAINIRG
jgi:flagellar basal-body rod protein FlgB